MTLRWWPNHKRMPKGWKKTGAVRVHSQGLIEILIIQSAP